MITKPPAQPELSPLPPRIREYLIALDKYLVEIYLRIKMLDLGQIKISSGDVVPADGNDGDLFVLVDSVNTRLYLNVNGAWIGYNSP